MTTHDELRSSLEELRSEVRRSDLSDADARARLDALIAAIEARLERGGGQRETILEHARELLGQLEAAHPQATNALNRIMIALGGAGI
jgi:Domain of unknown function (DUF4404)